MWFPNGAALEPMRSMLAVWMPRVAEIITLIGSHNLLTTPSRSQLADPKLQETGLIFEAREKRFLAFRRPD